MERERDYLEFGLCRAKAQGRVGGSLDYLPFLFVCCLIFNRNSSLSFYFQPTSLVVFIIFPTS